MPISFKTGGRATARRAPVGCAGCAEARRPKANGDRNNTIADARSMIRPTSFNLFSLDTNISMSLPSPPLGAQASLPAGLLTEASRQGCLRSQNSSTLLGLNLPRLVLLRLGRFRSRLLCRLLNRLLWLFLDTDHPS